MLVLNSLFDRQADTNYLFAISCQLIWGEDFLSSSASARNRKRKWNINHAQEVQKLESGFWRGHVQLRCWCWPLWQEWELLRLVPNQLRGGLLRNRSYLSGAARLVQDASVSYATDSSGMESRSTGSPRQRCYLVIITRWPSTVVSSDGTISE